MLDDSSAQGRVLAHTTQSQTWLQIGHLLQQNDNQRLAQRGHGLELHTQAQGAVRAGSGLHISTHARNGGTSGTQGQPTNTREAQAQLQSHAELVKALSENAQTHLAKLPNEAAPDQLPSQLAMQATLTSLKGVQSGGDAAASESGADSGSDMRTIDGGHGSIPVTDRPDLVLSAAADISGATPAHSVVSVGQHTTVSAGQDTNLLSQRHTAWAVKDGISLFTRGEAKDGQRAVQDVGMKLHAASGNVNVQAQSDAFTLTAAQAVDIQSTAASITISAPEKILLNGGGGYIKIEGGNIEIGTSGNASFLASMKELTGGGSASDSLTLNVPSELNLKPSFGPHSLRFAALGSNDLLCQAGWTGEPFEISDEGGQVLASGRVPEDGRLPRVTTNKVQELKLRLGDPGGAQLLPLPPQILEPVSDEEDAQLDVDSEEESDNATRELMSHRYVKDILAAKSFHHNAFLSEEAVRALLQEHADNA